MKTSCRCPWSKSCRRSRCETVRRSRWDAPLSRRCVLKWVYCFYVPPLTYYTRIYTLSTVPKRFLRVYHPLGRVNPQCSVLCILITVKNAKPVNSAIPFTSPPHSLLVRDCLNPLMHGRFYKSPLRGDKTKFLDFFFSVKNYQGWVALDFFWEKGTFQDDVNILSLVQI